MSNTASKEVLDNYLTTLADIVQELVPVPFDVNYIEAKSKHIWDLLGKHAELHDKLWTHLENILMSDLSDTIKIGYLSKFYERFIKQYHLFSDVYTNKSINPHYNNGKLYTSAQGYDNAAAAVGMIENDKHILVLFNEHYALPFPAPPMDWESVVMTNLASPIYKELFKTLVRLKPDWDKLTDYKSKLDFWFKNGLSIDHFTYFLTDDDAKKDLPENNITIYPFDKVDVPVWKHFYYEKFNKYNFNTLETSKGKYNKFIEDGADPIPLTKKIIEQIDNEFKEHDKVGQYEFKLYCVGYNASQNGQVKVFLDNGYMPNNPYYMRDFCTGVVHEKYRRFLKERLNELEKGNNPVKPPMNTNVEVKDFSFIYFLRRYIDMAVRWNISPITLLALKWNYDNARKEIGKFIKEFRTQKLSLNDIEKGNLYVDLKGEFYAMIDMYIDFYNNNIANIKQAINEPYPIGQSPYAKDVNPYSVLYDLCNDTKKAIEVLNVNAMPITDTSNKISPMEPINIRPNRNLNLEESLNYIKNVEDFEVHTELGRETGKDISFEDFKKMCSDLVSFDEIFEMGMKLKRGNENLTILMKPVSVKEVLKRFLIECKSQFELTEPNFMQWLDKREFYWRNFQKEKVEELNTALKKANTKRKKTLELTRKKCIALCGHFYAIIEIIKNEVLNNAINLNSALPKRKRNSTKLLTYKWQSNSENELPALYKKMKGGLINDETTKGQFLAVFTGLPVESITPIKWIAAKNLLAYFIDLMRSNNKVSLNTELWAIAKKCFEGANNLSQSRDLYLNSKSGKPTNHQLIDKLF